MCHGSCGMTGTADFRVQFRGGLCGVSLFNTIQATFITSDHFIPAETMICLHRVCACLLRYTVRSPSKLNVAFTGENMINNI